MIQSAQKPNRKVAFAAFTFLLTLLLCLSPRLTTPVQAASGYSVTITAPTGPPTVSNAPTLQAAVDAVNSAAATDAAVANHHHAGRQPGRQRRHRPGGRAK